MDCIILLTHNFNNEFINTLQRIDKDVNVSKYKVIVLFDNNNDYNNNINNFFKNIEIIKINKIITSYDNLGHSMYINYFKNNYDVIKNYRYIWIVENDVYYPNSLITFMNAHNSFQYDLLVGEYGTRSPEWCWTKSLKGFKNKCHIGVLAVIMRFSQRMLYKLIDNIDTNYHGYLEAILPHICIENDLTIQQFLPELCGVLTTYKNSPLIKLILDDINNNTKLFIENKIYHPVKL